MATDAAEVTVFLHPEQETFVRDRVSSGRYGSQSDVIAQALLLLEQQERGFEDPLADQQANINEGIAQAERGELIDADDVEAEMRQMLQERRRARSTAR